VTTTLTAPPPTGAVFATYEIRDLDTTPKLTRLAGRAVPYNTPADVGPFTEEFAPGSFARSIAQAAAGLPLLAFHNDRGFSVGISEEWREQPDGLHGVWRLDDTDEAQFAAKRARGGFLPYLSIRFMQDPDRFRFDNTRAKPHFIRQSARLVETSLTATPVYIDSTVTWVRSADPARPPAAVAEWTSYLEQIRKGPL
jgi:HK97 family phage prohead protease